MEHIRCRSRQGIPGAHWPHFSVLANVLVASARRSFRVRGHRLCECAWQSAARDGRHSCGRSGDNARGQCCLASLPYRLTETGPQPNAARRQGWEEDGLGSIDGPRSGASPMLMFQGRKRVSFAGIKVLLKAFRMELRFRSGRHPHNTHARLMLETGVLF